MSVVSVDETFGATGAHTLTEGRRYTRVFHVVVNSNTDGPNTAIQAVESIGIIRGAPYAMIGSSESDLKCWVQELTAAQGEDWLDWFVTVNYGWYDPNEAGGGKDQNPLLMPIDVSWAYRDFERAVEQDINGNPLLNSAFDPYDPPIVANIPNMLMTVVRNQAGFNAPLALTYQNAINSDVFGAYAALFVKVLKITPKNLFHQDAGWYYQVTYEFEIMNPRNSADNVGWRKLVLDRGLRRLTPGGAQVNITLNGTPVTQPMLLDGTGHLLKPTFTPVFNTYQIFPELPFSSVFLFDPTAISGTRSGFP